MALTQMRLSLRRNRMWGISLPDMAPFAGVVFLLVCFYMMTGKFKYGEEGLVTLEQLPKTSSWHCRIPENASIISVDAAMLVMLFREAGLYFWE